MWRRRRESLDGAAARAGIAYEQAVRGLDSQVAVLAETRTRANYLIVASIGVATLFAGFLLEGSLPGRAIQYAAALPLVLLLVGVSRAVGVLRPTGKQGEEGALQLVASAELLLKVPVASPTEARSQAALGLEELWECNQPLIENLMSRLRFSARCLEGQVASWTILLILKQVL